jgi:hypothetical protein
MRGRTVVAWLPARSGAVAGDELADVHDKEEEGKNRTKCFFV